MKLLLPPSFLPFPLTPSLYFSFPFYFPFLLFYSSVSFCFPFKRVCFPDVWYENYNGTNCSLRAEEANAHTQTHTHTTLQDNKLAGRPKGRLWTEWVPAQFGSCLWIVVLRKGWRRAACLPNLHPFRQKHQTDTASEFKEREKPWEDSISEQGDSLYIICMLLQTAHMKNIFSFTLKICRMQNLDLSFLESSYVTLLPILGHCQGNFPNYPKQLKDA